MELQTAQALHPGGPYYPDGVPVMSGALKDSHYGEFLCDSMTNTHDRL